MANSWGYLPEVDALANAADAAAAAVARIRSYGGQDEAAARGRLGAFWNIKNQIYGALSPQGQAQATTLDIWVKNLWSRMAQQLSFIAAKDDDAAQARYAAEAKQASDAAQALVSAAGRQGTAMSRSVNNTAADAKVVKAYGDTNAIDATYSTAFLDQAKKVANEAVFGIPLWVWLAGGVAVFLLIETVPVASAIRSARRSR